MRSALTKTRISEDISACLEETTLCPLDSERLLGRLAYTSALVRASRLRRTDAPDQSFPSPFARCTPQQVDNVTAQYHVISSFTVVTQKIIIGLMRWLPSSVCRLSSDVRPVVISGKRSKQRTKLL